MYTLVMQNTGTRVEYVVTGLTNTSPSILYYKFNRFKMPEDAPEGEYRCVLFWNDREDCVFHISDDLLESVVETGEGEVKLKDLWPEVFLMRYGLPDSSAPVNQKNKGYVYYKRK